MDTSDVPAAPKQYEYFGFISYKRANLDVAKFFQRSLEKFRMPVFLDEKDAPPPENRPPESSGGFLRKIFLDKTDLDARSDDAYWIAINRALDGTRWLIVICTEKAAASDAVNREIMRFRETHGVPGNPYNGVIPVLAGSPEKVLPPALKDWMIDDADNPGEKIYAAAAANNPNLVPGGGETKGSARRDALVTLISRMLGVRRELIQKRYAEEERREMLRKMAALAVAFVLVLAFAVWALFAERRATDRAEQVEESFDFITSVLKSGDPYAGGSANETVYDAMVSSIPRVDSLKHPRVRGNVARTIGEILLSYPGDKRIPLALFEKAKAANTEYAGERSREAEETDGWIGVCFGVLGDREKARAYLEKQARFAEKYDDDKVRAHVNINLAAFAVWDGNLAEGEAFYAKAIAALEKNPGLDPCALAFSRLMCAMSVAFPQKRLDDAERGIEAALKTLQESGNAGHPYAAFCRVCLFGVYNARRDFSHDPAPLEEALAVMKKRYGEGAATLAVPYEYLACAYLHRGDFSRASESAERLLALKDAMPEADRSGLEFQARRLRAEAILRACEADENGDAAARKGVGPEERLKRAAEDADAALALFDAAKAAKTPLGYRMSEVSEDLALNGVVRAHMQLAFRLIERGDWGVAREHVERALAVVPRFSSVADRRGFETSLRELIRACDANAKLADRGAVPTKKSKTGATGKLTAADGKTLERVRERMELTARLFSEAADFVKNLAKDASALQAVSRLEASAADLSELEQPLSEVPDCPMKALLEQPFYMELWSIRIALGTHLLLAQNKPERALAHFRECDRLVSRLDTPPPQKMSDNLKQLKLLAERCLAPASEPRK